MKWVSTLFINVIVTMICIYIIKYVSIKYNIPFMKKVAEEV